MSATIKYEHVDSHMDTYFFWQQLLFEQKINVMCDSLATYAVSRAIRSGMTREGN